MFANEVIKEKGKVIKRYAHKDVKTPLVALEQLLHKGLAKLKPGQTLAALQQQAKAKADSAAAQEMQLATAALFASFNTQRLSEGGNLQKECCAHCAQAGLVKMSQQLALASIPYLG